MINTNKAFTLSEVLLVLSIIGVVAALTIPTLINKVSKDQNVAKLKKEYSVLSQAFNLLLADNGGDITSIFSNGADSGANVMNAFATKLNIIKNCGTSTGCWYTTPRYNLSGGAFENNFEAAHISQYGKAIMADGAMILAVNISSNCSSNGGIGPLANSVCGEFLIDLNGAAGPNTVGRDFYYIWITKTGIYPHGSYNDTYNCTTDGTGCTAKILSEGAMNY